MAKLKLLTAIRAQVAERGITLTDLARAAGVQPGNLRRMLSSTAATPRLGSVMRLLLPLHCRVAPAGARTAAELAAYLDEQRRRQKLDWDQLLDQMGAGAEKINLPTIKLEKIAGDARVEILVVVFHTGHRNAYAARR